MEGISRGRTEGQRGDTLVILESMKMEFPVTAEYSGIIEKVYLKPGEQVNSGQLAAKYPRVKGE